MAEYEYLWSKGLFSVLKVFFSPEPEFEMKPEEWLFDYYTQKGYYFYYYNDVVRVSQDRFESTPKMNLEDIQGHLREFMESVSKLIEGDQRSRY